MIALLVVSQSLIAAGQCWDNGVGVRSLITGRQDDTLQAMVEKYAEHLAAIGYQDGHAGFNRRYQTLMRQLPEFTNFQEITTESWPDKNSEEEGAFEAWNSWSQSPGHWSVANGECALWGYSMAFCRRNSKWFAVGICADQRGHDAPQQTGRFLGLMPKRRPD